ncbi:hypothetical protein CMV_026241 [Castanea mollissima]|uniref:Ion transport domain-containing protein n=1 Tax=Castanea mollissima TaxID=60419 RepID=A0A8J4VFG7_9ROSI|nr:hypothetical protein CMV_026241 [Castanea mollissima]
MDFMKVVATVSLVIRNLWSQLRNGVSNYDIERQPHKDGGGDSASKRTRTKTIIDPHGKFLQRWNIIFVLSCVIAILLDPLFFYLPVINGDRKCIELDKRLWTRALFLRSFNDMIYLMHIILQFRTGFIDKKLQKLGRPALITDSWKIAQRYLWPYFLLDLLVILPIPQVVTSWIFSEMAQTKSSNKIKLFNSFVLLQYVPRILPIYLSWKKLIRSNEKIEKTIWFKAALNFFLYLLAGHVLGAFWYFFSTQRMTACWHKYCERETGCVQSSFNRDLNEGNHTFLNNVCRINKPDAKLFDFGIFLEALQSGVFQSTDFPQKLFYCFWWGLQNLSSLGQNLHTSNYIWENCFSLSICILGLLLFLYFLGIYRCICSWKLQDQKSEIRKPIIDDMNQRFKEDEDVYLESLLPNLPGELQNNVKEHIGLKRLKIVEVLRVMEEQMLRTMCQSETNVPQRAQLYYSGERPNRCDIFHYGWNCEYFGKELLGWVQKSTASRNNLSKLPVSSRTLKAHTKVEVFALMAQDLKQILHSKLSSLGPEQLPSAAASVVQRIWRCKQPKSEDSVGASTKFQNNAVVKSKKAATILLPPCYRLTTNP